MSGRLFDSQRIWMLAAAYALLALLVYAALVGPLGLAVHPSYWAFAAGTGLLALYTTRVRCGWALVLALACEAAGTLAAAADAVYVLPAAALVAGGLIVVLHGLAQRPGAG